MLNPERGAMALLDASATALLTAGYADPLTDRPALRLRCLHAGERLQRLGARPEHVRTLVRFDEVAGAIVLAFVGLALLSDDDCDVEIAEATAALRAALAELG